MQFMAAAWPAIASARRTPMAARSIRVKRNLLWAIFSNSNFLFWLRIFAMSLGRILTGYSYTSQYIFEIMHYLHRNPDLGEAGSRRIISKTWHHHLSAILEFPDLGPTLFRGGVIGRWTHSSEQTSVGQLRPFRQAAFVKSVARRF
ncbi:MAG: hypothetical protein HQ482_01155 [Sphingomonadales bacterium]|nr:hypothetical protein [Sphingomonadales bacterium]